MSDEYGFAKWLLAEGFLNKEDLRRATDSQRGRLGSLDTEIIDLKLMSEQQTLDALGRFHHTRTVTGAELEFASSAAVAMLTPRIASRLGVVPFKLEGRTLSVATQNPGDLLVEDEIAQLTGCMVASFVALEVRFIQALNRHYQAPITARFAGLIRRLSGVAEKSKVEQARRILEDAEQESAPPRVVEPARPPERSRPAAKPAAEAVELSADDHELFPSLAAESDAPAPAGDALSGEVVLDHDRTGAPPEAAAAGEIGPEELLQAASLAMQNVEMRDDIADAMLGFCAPLFHRRMMLVRRKGVILGWRGEGPGMDETAVRSISVPVDEPSVFSGLFQGVDFWLGPLPTMPRNKDLVLALGAPAPKDCYILPVKVRDRVVCFLYGDNRDQGVGGLPLGELKRLGGKAGLAFQIYLLKGKIRSS